MAAKITQIIFVLLIALMKANGLEKGVSDIECKKYGGECHQSCFGKTNVWDSGEPRGCIKSTCCLPKNTECPSGVPVVNCFVEPCLAAECQAYPDANCWSNYCGGCNANFYIDDRLVTSDCEGPCFQSGGECREKCTAEESSSGNNSCLKGRKCCLKPAKE